MQSGDGANTAVSHEEAIKQFVEDMIAQAGVSAMSSDAARQYLVDDLTQRLLDQIDRALVEALPDGSVAAFNALLDREETSPEQIQKFISDAGVDVQRVTMSTMLQFRDLYLQNVGE